MDLGRAANVKHHIILTDPIKKAAGNISSTSSDSGQKSAQVPTMSCTAAEREETSSDEDGSWLFDHIDISGAKEFGEDYYQKAKALFIKYQNTRQHKSAQVPTMSCTTTMS